VTTVVGIWGTGTTGVIVNQSAFIWDATNNMRDLISLLPSGSGWLSLTEANGIDSSGDIIGVGDHQISNNPPVIVQHAFLRTPSGTGPQATGQSGPPPLDAGTAQAPGARTPPSVTLGMSGSGADSASTGSLSQTPDASDTAPGPAEAMQDAPALVPARADASVTLTLAAADWGGWQADGPGGPLG
jgi:hypothetical protein